MARAAYQYDDLGNPDLRPVRLLHLHAGDPDSPLSCDLEHTTLKDSPKFEALSYVWGAQNLSTSPISVRKGRELCTLEILPSLRSALLRLRNPGRDRTLWVDAVCINQADTVERSKQVPMMGDIYHSAQSVIVWLGEERDRSDLALSFIHDIVDLSHFDHAVRDLRAIHQWYSLSRLMNRSWFRRRWVVQELALARDARIYCGNGEVDWSSFSDAVTLFGLRKYEIARLFKASPEYGHDVDIFGEIEALGALSLIDALNRLFRRSGDGEILEGLVSLETLVTSLNAFETGDPRDCIYAVMDLAQDVQYVATSADSNISRSVVETPISPKLCVDYDLPFEEVARSFVAFCIQSSDSLDIICRPWSPMTSAYTYHSMPQSGHAKIAPKLPSWARPLEESVFEIREDGRHVRRRGDSFVGIPGRPIYDASKNFPTFGTFFPPPEYRLHPSTMAQHKRVPEALTDIAQFPNTQESETFKPLRMQVKGIQIGIISRLGERAMEGMIPSEWFFMADWPSRRAPAPEAFWRTLVADRGPDGKNPPAWYKRALEHALSYSGTGDVIVQRLITHPKSSITAEFLKRVQAVIWNRRFAITSLGAFGLVPAHTMPGDVIMVLYGASVPMVLRKLVSSYVLIGECYIHGAMAGLKTRPTSKSSQLKQDSSPYVTSEMVGIVNIR